MAQDAALDATKALIREALMGNAQAAEVVLRLAVDEKPTKTPEP